MTLELIGAPGSPYTRKMRSLLRYRRIPFVFKIRGSKHATDVPDIPVELIPILVHPGEGGAPRAVIDSTPMLRELETLYDGRGVVPEDPALALVDAILEDYGDEWLTKAMFHYRWSYRADIDKAANILPLWRDVTFHGEELEKLSTYIGERQIERLWVVGSNERTGAVIEDSYRRFLHVLDEHLATQPFLLVGEHSPFARADPRSRQLRTHREGDLRLLAQGPEGHVRDKQGQLQDERLPGPRADHGPRLHRCIVKEREAVKLRGEDLDVIPPRQGGSRDAHRSTVPMVTPLLQAMLREVLDLAHLVLLVHRMGVRVLSQILVAIEGLGVRLVPGPDLVRVDAQLPVLHPGAKLLKLLRVVVLADAGVDPVIPEVHPAHKVSARNEAIGEERTAVMAAPVQH